MPRPISFPELNAEQLQAVTFACDRPLKVVAGAGTGKTTVLAGRFLHLVAEKKMSPQRILALTFTKKAAAEMRDRIVKGLVERDLAKRSDLYGLWIGTFHSVAARLLREYAFRTGLDSQFRVALELEQTLAFRQAQKDLLNLKIVGAPSDHNALLELGITSDSLNWDSVSDTIGKLKDRLVSSDEFAQWENDKISDLYKNLGAEFRAEDQYQRAMRSVIGAVYKRYDEILAACDQVDFDDLILKALRLTERMPELRRRFAYILVDEFQDTSRGQLEFLKALAAPKYANVTVVGDRKQSIYEWRQARLENVDEFEGETIALKKNYRSEEEILKGAQQFIKNSMPEEPELVAARAAANLDGGRPVVKLFRCDSAQVEAEFVAAQAAQLVATGRRKPGDMVLLMRSVKAAGVYEKALRSRGFKVRVIGEKSFIEHDEVRSLVAYLRAVVDPFDDVAVVRCLSQPPFSVDCFRIRELRDALARNSQDNPSPCLPLPVNGEGEMMPPPLLPLSVYGEGAGGWGPVNEKGAGGRDASIIEVLIHASASGAAQDLVKTVGGWCRLMHELQSEARSLSISELISSILEKTGFFGLLISRHGRSSPEADNITRFYKLALQYEDRTLFPTIRDFLEFVSVYSDENRAVSATELQADDDVMHVMTVHQAKGLEFPVVFLPGLRVSPYKERGIVFDEAYGPLLPKTPDGAEVKYVKDGRPRRAERRLREERRILYVAMTRAKDLLYVSTHSLLPEGEDDFFAEIQKFANEESLQRVEIVSQTASGVAEITPISEAGEPPASQFDAATLEAQLRAALRRIASLSPAESAMPLAPKRYSFSELELYRQCPVLYWFRHVLGFPEEPLAEDPANEKGIDPTLLGSLVHETLMFHHRVDKARNAEQLLDLFASVYRSRLTGNDAELLSEYESAAKPLLTGYLGCTASRAETIAVEAEFDLLVETANGPRYISGKIDRITRTENGVRLLEYKTGRPDPEQYRFQLALYRAGAEDALGLPKPATAVIHLRAAEEEEYVFEPAQIEAEIKNAIRAIEAIERGEFRSASTISVSERCKLCGYHTLCCRGEAFSRENASPLLNNGG